MRTEQKTNNEDKAKAILLAKSVAAQNHIHPDIAARLRYIRSTAVEAAIESQNTVRSQTTETKSAGFFSRFSGYLGLAKFASIAVAGLLTVTLIQVRQENLHQNATTAQQEDVAIIDDQLINSILDEEIPLQAYLDDEFNRHTNPEQATTPAHHKAFK